ncbi:unnamed protein product [Urochloa humidicola]
MSPAATTARSCPDPDATSATASMANDDDDPLFPDATKGGYHVLRIDGYSRTFNENSGVPRFESGPFRAGGRTWRIGYYPKGTYLSNRDFIAVYLFLADAVAEPVKIAFEFSILGPYLEPLELPSRGRLEYTFSAPGSSYGYETFVGRETLEQVTALLDYDCLVVKVELRIVDQEPSTMLPPSDMGKHLADLLSSKEHTDVEFRVGGETFAAHRLLLEARSPIFTAKLLGRNKEHKATTVVQIDDMEPRVFEAMLSFMYTDSWPKMEDEEESAISQRLFVAADQYGLKRLKLMCESRLCNLIDSYSMQDVLYLAEKHQSAALKEACFDYIGSTATLVPVREEFLEVRESQKLQFDRLVSLFSTITKDQISNVFENDWSSKSIEAIDITLDIQ